MPIAHFALGSALNTMVNIETLISRPPGVLPSRHAAYLGGVRTRVRSGKVRRDGFIDAEWLFDSNLRDDSRTLVYNTVGDFSTASIELFIMTAAEDGKTGITIYNPYKAWVERALIGENFSVATKSHNSDEIWLLHNLRLQSATKTSNFTVTTSDHLLYADTSSGSVTFTLPAANAVNANVIYRFEKTSASNTMTVQRAGLDTVDGGTSIAKTALRDVVQIVSDGSSAWTSVTS